MVLVPDVDGQFVAIIVDRHVADCLMLGRDCCGRRCPIRVLEFARCTLKLRESRCEFVKCRSHRRLKAEQAVYRRKIIVGSFTSRKHSGELVNGCQQTGEMVFSAALYR